MPYIELTSCAVCKPQRWAKRIGMFVLLLVLGGCSDYLPFSSGALMGNVSAPPESWSDVAQDEIIQFETNPDAPYTVNLWVVGEDKKLYVFAGDNRTTWVQNIEQNPLVRLGIGTAVYELHAQRVTDADEFEWFAQAWDTKYGHRPRNENVSETWLMRLTPRT